jgi:general secretion pathway protein N
MRLRPAHLLWMTAGILVACVINAPASLVDRILASASGERAHVEQAAGTLWSGSGDLRVQTPQGTLVLPALRWDIHPGTLWRGHIGLQLESASAALSGHLDATLSPGGLTLGSHDLRLSVGILAPQIPALAAIGPAGLVALSGDAVQINPDRVAGQATVQVESMRSARLGPMGDYRIELTGDGAGARFELGTQRGPIRLEGSGRIGLDGQLRFAGLARASGPDADRLGQNLASFGIPRPDGSVAIAWPIGASTADPARPGAGASR